MEMIELASGWVNCVVRAHILWRKHLDLQDSLLNGSNQFWGWRRDFQELLYFLDPIPGSFLELLYCSAVDVL